jgi:hypothetical protein
MRASINEAAPGGAGTDLGTPLGAVDTLGALESLRARDACGAAGAAADDALGECWTVDGGRLPGEEQAEPSTTTKVKAPNSPTFKAHHLSVSGHQRWCKD